MYALFAMDLIQIIEIVAVILGLGNVYFLTQQKLIAWPLGLSTVSLYAYIFYQSNLLSDFVLHLVYIILNIYGWWYWIYGNKRKNELSVTRLPPLHRWFLTIFVLLGFLVWGYFMKMYTSTDYAYADAFTTVASLAAQYLMAKKKIENWIIWMMVNVVATQIYFAKGLYPTSFLFLVFLGLSIYGFKEWRSSLHQAQQAEVDKIE